MNGAQLLLVAVLGSMTGASIHTSLPTETVVQQMTSRSQQLPDEGALPSLGGATLWLNLEPLTAASLRGKVVLIDFSTYTCINWLRTLPYVRAWAEKYKDQGLVVINVQTPEFEFEKNIDNVRWASKQMGSGATRCV
jgi:thiol-disulfide isomerase/thioredoxin